MYKPLEDTLVIGFGHKARNGKDTAAGVMQDYFGKDARRYAFADALRAVCRVCYGMKEKDAPLLQMVGTDLYRRVNPNIWTDVLYETLKEQRPKVALISDMRFPNEAEMVKGMGGITIRCIRLNPDGRQFIDPSRSSTHPSETALDEYCGWDFTIRAHSVSALEEAVLRIAGEQCQYRLIS